VVELRASVAGGPRRKIPLCYSVLCQPTTELMRLPGGALQMSTFERLLQPVGGMLGL
jgi:hypothetical protein